MKVEGQLGTNEHPRLIIPPFLPLLRKGLPTVCPPEATKVPLFSYRPVIRWLMNKNGAELNSFISLIFLCLVCKLSGESFPSSSYRPVSLT